MAIEPVKKIRIIAHKDVQDDVIEALQEAGTVHVERLSEEELLQPREVEEVEVEQVRRCTYAISQTEFLLGFFKQYGFQKTGFFQTLIKEKYPMTLEAFARAPERIDLELAYQECSELERRLSAIDEEHARLSQEREDLSDWTELQMDLDEIEGTHIYGMMLVRLPEDEVEDAVSELAEEAPESALDVLCERGDLKCCVVVYHPESLEAVEEVLARHKPRRATLPRHPLEPAERLEQVDREMAALLRRREILLTGVRAHAEKRSEIEILREYLVNQRRNAQLTTQFGRTRATVVIEGWVTEENQGITKSALGTVAGGVAVELSDLGEDDHPPVSLKNRKWVRPFEMLTRLYGIPNGIEYDPTWLIAISFVAFFGFCIGDVGYGLVIVVAFLLMRRFLPLGRNVKDLLLVMAYGGAFAMVIGVITGSWFGINPENLPSFLQSLAVLDPLRDPIPVMGICMALGLIHMMSGTIVEFRDNIRDGEWLSAIIDQGLVFLFFIALGVAVPLALAKVVPTTVAFLIGITPVVLMLLLLGRSAKSVPGKAINGLYETYNTVVGWMGDTISYVRLYALGLATFVIGWVVNTLAGMVQGMAPVIGILLALLVLLIGHTFNVTINLLGAFVHPLRLEFVEFFGKFYEDGGREFSPMGVDSKIVIIEKDGA